MSAAPYSRNGIAPKAVVLIAGLISSLAALTPAVAAPPAAATTAAGSKTAAPPPRDLPQLLACMRANSPTRLRGQKVTMELREHGELMRTLRGQLYVKRDTAPGTAAICRDDLGSRRKRAVASLATGSAARTCASGACCARRTNRIGFRRS